MVAHRHALVKSIGSAMASIPRMRDIPIQDGSSGDGDVGEVGRFKHLGVKGRVGEHRVNLPAGVTVAGLVNLVGELGRRKGFGERDMANGWIDVARLRTFIAGGIYFHREGRACHEKSKVALKQTPATDIDLK